MSSYSSFHTVWGEMGQERITPPTCTDDAAEPRDVDSFRSAAMLRRLNVMPRPSLFRRWWSLLLTGLAGTSALQAQVTFYSGATAHSDWAAAAGGTPTVLDFEGYANGTNSNTGALATQAAAAGIVFRPFGNPLLFPQVRDSTDGGIGAIGVNWLGNNLSQGFAATDSISWTFNRAMRAFGFYDVGTNDGFEVTVYSAGIVSLGTFLTAEQPGTPLFWGFIVDQDVGRVDIKPRNGFGNGYIGIDGLSTVAVPEPAAVALLLGAGALLGAWRRSSRIAR